jgi:PiT family inorganic phosphate transporter
VFDFRLLAGALMGWTLGANDTASVFGLAITTQVIRARNALLLTALFVIIGAVLQGQEGIATYGSLSAQTLHTAFIIALIPSLAIAVTATIGLPASTTQAVVGAMVGISLMRGDVQWPVFAKLGIAWALAPIGTMLFALILYFVVSRTMERWLKQLSMYEAMLRIGFVIVGAYGAYSLGANNVANVVGVWVEAGALSLDQAVWFGAIAIAVGSLTFSRRVIAGVGHRIVELDPFSGFIATLSGALMLHAYAIFGVPVSASQAIVGAIVGIGLVKGVQTVQTKSIVQIVIAWFVVPVLTMLLAMLAITIFPG